MKLEGAYFVPAPRQVVWQKLLDPAVLARALPGVQTLSPDGEGSYSAELKIGIGAVKGTYRGRVQILDAVPLERYRMKVEGKGAAGFVNGEGTFTLSDEAAQPGTAGTRITYQGEAQIGGLIASVGQRLLQGAAHKIVAQFFEAFARDVAAATAAPPPAP